MKRVRRNRKSKANGKGKFSGKDDMVAITIEIPTWEERKLRALEEISKKRAILHRHIFTGDYNYKEISKNIGQIKIQADKGSNYRKRNYAGMAYRTINENRLRIFYHRLAPVLPKCIIEVSSPSREVLIRLNESLSGLNLSSIEFTLDLYCSNSVSVGRLFNALLKYCYVPSCRIVRFHRGHSPRNRQTRRLNRSYYIGKLKIYERGEDKTPWGQGWYRSELDRVRVEFKANSELLGNNGMNSFEDFIANCNFERIFMPRFQFKVFEGSSRLPKENDTYALVNGHESFQQQLIDARDRGRPKNPNKYVKDAQGFEKVREQVLRKIRKFDRDWQSN